MFKWDLHGLIFRPKLQGLSWMASHAWVPTPFYIGDGKIELYFATRNKRNLSQIGRIKINLDQPDKIIELSSTPVLKLGRLGCFDDSAVLPSQVFIHNGQLQMIYVGWMQGKNVPFHAALGLAKSNDLGKTFQRASEAPIIDRSAVDPIFVSSAFVLPEKKRFMAWYTSALDWEINDKKLKENYLIKFATAKSPSDWQRRGKIAIRQNNFERAISRPWVLREENQFLMWYSYRSLYYRIGFAESIDGRHWTRRDDHSQIPKSKCGFDSQMQEYASVVKYKGKLFMFYNGNNYGEEGIALATTNLI